MPIVKRDCVIENAWRKLDGRDLTELDGRESVLMTLGEWRAQGAAARGRFVRLGVALAPSEEVDDIADDLSALSLVALMFPKFNDGRAFSQARLLRERHGYTGEVRATGHVIRDQFLFLQRSGFDAVEVASPAELGPWISARQRFTGYYQPALDTEQEADEVSLVAAVPIVAVQHVDASEGSVAALWAY